MTHESRTQLDLDKSIKMKDNIITSRRMEKVYSSWANPLKKKKSQIELGKKHTHKKQMKKRT